MKFGAIICLYDDHEYLDICVEPLKKLDNVLFLISSVPWNGKVSDNSETINKVKELCSKNKNFELFQKYWTNEADQRNFGLSCFYSRQIDYAFIVDTDEIYHEYHFNNIIEFIKQNSSYSAFHVEWNTYWKKSYHVIYPREQFKPIIAVKVNSFVFTENRLGTTSVIRSPIAVLKTQDTYNGVLIPSSVAICYHLSYARTDDFIKRKIETFSHANEVNNNWYENVWLKWQTNSRNLHPVTPVEYQIAIEENLTTLPEQLQLFIKSERRRGYSIIVLNWNSCELLKKCISLIDQYTKGYELIIVDNGSKSIEYVESIKSVDLKNCINVIKVFNKENLGFAGGVNSGLKVVNNNNDICLLNVDAEVTENWLNNLYETLLTKSTCGIVGPLGNEVQSGYQKEGYVKQDTQVPNLMGFCILILKEVYDKIGLFDERFKIGGYEDNDYGMRAMLAGWTLWLSAKSLVKHKAHQVFKLNNLDYMNYDPINKDTFYNKFYSILLNYSKYFDLYRHEQLAKITGIKI